MSIDISWSDTVIVAQDAPGEFNPGLRGSVSGMREGTGDRLEDESSAKGRLYLVEFSDGKAIEIPGRYLRKEED